MLRRIVLGFVAFVLCVAGLYALNPLGTATLDPRARLLGFAVYRIRSESMAPTLVPGQVVWVSTFALRFDPPQRGDLIAFRYPADPGVVIVGRLIGEGGDTVSIADGEVSIDGRVLTEPYLGNRRLTKDYSLRMEAIRVPAEQLFILGDNRDNAHDSRFWGTLPADQVVGKITSTIGRWRRGGTGGGLVPVRGCSQSVGVLHCCIASCITWIAARFRRCSVMCRLLA